MCAEDFPLILLSPPQRVPPLHPVHGGQVPPCALLLAQPPGGELHHQHTQALFLQLHQQAGGVRGPARQHPDHPHPGAGVPHVGHDRPGGLVQQEERHPGLRTQEDKGGLETFAADFTVSQHSGNNSLMYNWDQQLVGLETSTDRKLSSVNLQKEALRQASFFPIRLKYSFSSESSQPHPVVSTD